MMTYESAVAALLQLGHELAAQPRAKFDLAHMQALALALGRPDRRFPSVLIAGTNGKGSTAATLASILRAAGFRTGLYTSPHLRRPNERIRLDGQPIADHDFAGMFGTIQEMASSLVGSDALPHSPSFFEALTAMALEYFAQAGVEVAVLEVGMGGRLDATNVVDPLLSVITDIALDHERYLGNTIGEIAREKCGIMRPGGITVTLPQHPEANETIGRMAVEIGAHVVSAASFVPPLAGSSTSLAFEFPVRNRYSLEVLGREIEIDSPLVGRHQMRNLALAVAAAVQLADLGLPVPASALEKGIRETEWPGRFQVLPPRGPDPAVVLDVAHNPAGAWALRSTLSERFPGHPLVIVFGAMRDKAIREMAEILFPLAETVFATQAATANPRAATPEEIVHASRHVGPVIGIPGVARALDEARSVSKPQGIILVTGSIYIVGEALSLLEVEGNRQPQRSYSTQS